MGEIAIVGASGAVGIAVAATLRAQGRPYRVIGRDAARLERLFGSDPLAARRTWDTQSAESAAAALDGCERAIYLIGVEYWKFELHPLLTQRAIDGAKAAGVKRFLLVGTVYPYGAARAATVSEDHPREPTTYKGRMRKEQEDLVLAAHVPGVFETTELKLPDLYGPGMEKSFLTSVFKNAPAGKTSQMLAPAGKPHEYAFIPDCGDMAVRVLDEPRAYGRFWNYGGPGTIAPRAFADAIYAACGTKPKYLFANQTMLRVLGLFDPMMRELVEMNYLLTDPVVMDDSQLRALLGDLPKTSYADGIRATLAAET